MSRFNETIIKQRENKYKYWDDGNVWLERFSDDMIEVVDKTLLKVQCIADNAFVESKIEQMIMPDNIIKLDSHSFSHCRNLKKVKISKNIQNIPFACFENCYNLEEVIIPEGVETISSYAFGECWSLKEVALPSTIKKIYSRAFYGTQIKVLNVPKTCEEIGDEVLMDGEIHFYDSENIVDNTIETNQRIIEGMIRECEYQIKIEQNNPQMEEVVKANRERLKFLEDLRDGKIDLRR